MEEVVLMLLFFHVYTQWLLNVNVIKWMEGPVGGGQNKSESEWDQRQTSF